MSVRNQQQQQQQEPKPALAARKAWVEGQGRAKEGVEGQALANAIGGQSVGELRGHLRGLRGDGN